MAEIDDSKSFTAVVRRTEEFWRSLEPVWTEIAPGTEDWDQAIESGEVIRKEIGKTGGSECYFLYSHAKSESNVAASLELADWYNKNSAAEICADELAGLLGTDSWQQKSKVIGILSVILTITNNISVALPVLQEVANHDRSSVVRNNAERLVMEVNKKP